MNLDLPCTREADDYYRNVVLKHNERVQPYLVKAMDYIRGLLAEAGFYLEVKDMGSRGFTWKNPTNYEESDFEIAIVGYKDSITRAGHYLMYRLLADHVVAYLTTKAGLPYITIPEFHFGGCFSNKFEICFQTPEQNNAICANYAKWVGVPGEVPRPGLHDAIAAYISAIRAVRDDPVEYNKMKEWLRVL